MKNTMKNTINNTVRTVCYEFCQLCPRMCQVNRQETFGFCRGGDKAKIARAALHQWEEPCISGTVGSGAVFFSNCTLSCVFCQNFKISQEGFGKEVSSKELSEIFLKLQEQGAHNLNLVTASHYLPSVLEALDMAKPYLHIPVVYNCGGYERVEILRELSGYVDIYLPDLKYYDDELAVKYSRAPKYFSQASAAIKEMIRQTGELTWNPAAPNLLQKGVIIRHMVLPGARSDSIKLLRWISDSLPKGRFLLSIMSQYTPFYMSGKYSEINRKLTSYEYEKVIDAAIELGLTNGYMQKKTSAREEYTPPFDLTGISV